MTTFPYNLRRVAAALLAFLCLGCGHDVIAALPSPSIADSGAAPYRPAAGTVVAVAGDTVALLAGGPPAFRAILDLISGAHRSVHVEMYEFGRQDLVAALIGAHLRGLEVTVIDDPSVDVTAVAATRLRSAGVDVLDYPVRPKMIDHVKLLVVDGGSAIVGGINWGTRSDRNHDFDVRVTGNAAHNLERVFTRDLIACGRATQTPEPIPDEAVLVAGTLPGAEIRPLILSAIDAATRSLDLQLFVLTDTGVVHALERAAQRGVVVHVLLDPGQRPSDLPAAILRAHGVPVRLFRSRGELLHAKAMVADSRTVVVGSANWSGGGFSRNHELDIVLPDAPAVAADMLRPMRADWTRADGAGPSGSVAAAEAA